MSTLLERSQSQKQADYAQKILDGVNTKIDKMISKLKNSEFYIHEDEPGTNQSFASYVYNRLGVSTQEIIESLHGDNKFADEKRSKLISSLENVKKYLNEKASAKFIIDNCQFGLGEIFIQVFKGINRKK